MIPNKRCSRCHLVKSLSEFYMHKSGKDIGKAYSRCIDCEKELAHMWHDANREKERIRARGRIKQHLDYVHRTGRQRPKSENKTCSAYLGEFIAERALSKFFDNITKMPQNNPGYDFICGKGFKIDVKSACMCKADNCIRWNFTIKRNTIADYFLCLAFDNRENLNPLHIWLIPGNVVHHLWLFAVVNSEKSFAKWSRYEKPLDKVTMCCEKLREEA